MSHVKEEERSSRQRELEKEAEEHKRLMAREEHAEQLRFLIIIVVMISTNIIRLERERAEQRRAQENADHESKLVRCCLFLDFVFCFVQIPTIKYPCSVQIFLFCINIIDLVVQVQNRAEAEQRLREESDIGEMKTKAG